MYVDVVFTPCELESRGDISDKSVIVIDVLRATTTIAYAFWGYRENNLDQVLGCSKVIPVESLDKAKETAKNFDKDEILLTGERFCLKPEGFDLGNSPDEYTPEKVRGKTIIFTTTNGTRALKLAEKGNAKFITTAAFVNASACADLISQKPDDVLILCAGRSNKTTREDSACAGLMVDLLLKRSQEFGFKFLISDSADISAKFFDHYKHDLLGMFKESEAGQNLIQVKLEKDLADCSLIDVLSIVTEYKNGCITAKSI